MKLSQRVVLKLIKIYQIARQGKLSPCRFVPSCSEYMCDAVTEHGTYRGILLGAKRILRCRPHGGFGIDPVPTKEEYFFNRHSINKRLSKKQMARHS